MNRNLITSLGIALALAAGVLAQSTDTATPAASSAKAEGTSAAKTGKTAGYPFRGKLKSVDKDAKTFTLVGKEKDRVFHVTSETKFTKDGKAVTLTDSVRGDDVAGYARTVKDGRIEAATVRFGPAPESSTKKSPAKKASAAKETTSTK